MKWRNLFGAVALVALTLNVFAQTEPVEQAPPEASSDQETFETLESSVPEFDYFETRFGDIMAEIASDYDLQFWLHESLKQTELSEDTLFTASMENVRLATFLDLILEKHDSTWAVKDGIVLILSNEAAKQPENMNVMVFDCTGLISSTGGQPFVLSDRNQNLVHQAIDPKSWEVNGGNGTAIVAGKVLVVRQTCSNLRAVRQFLDQLNDVRADQETQTEQSASTQQ